MQNSRFAKSQNIDTKAKDKIKRKHYIWQVYVSLLSLQQRKKKALIVCPSAALQWLITAIHTKQA